MVGRPGAWVECGFGFGGGPGSDPVEDAAGDFLVLQNSLIVIASGWVGGGPREVDTGVKSLSSDLHHNFKITLEIKR